MVQQWIKTTYGIRVLILVVPHTFGRHLDFKPHLHLLVSSGGLHESGVGWIHRVVFRKNALMHMWRYAVITYLREALRARVLKSCFATERLQTILTTQYERW